jgi:hypothetical protein
MVRGSPALVASERSMLNAQEQALAAELARGPGDVEMELAAAALASVSRVLYYEAAAGCSPASRPTKRSPHCDGWRGTGSIV